MTREEILSIEEYCAEHKVSHRKRLEELEIPFWHFYKAKKKYREDDEQDGQSGQFIQLSSRQWLIVLKKMYFIGGLQSIIYILITDIKYYTFLYNKMYNITMASSQNIH